MKRLLFVVLMMVCSVAWAEWNYTGETARYIYFHDKSTIRRDGAFVQMWTLTNYFEAKTRSYGSAKSGKDLWKYDCKEQKQAIVSLNNFSEPMGNGRVIYSVTLKESELEWEPVVPESTGLSEWKIACGKQ